ncbi:MAG: transposase [bacterium]
MRHYHENGMIYSITSVTKGRACLFEDRLACCLLTKCIGYYKLILSFKLYGFVIMPDHIHCIIQPQSDMTVSKIMNYIKGNFARKYNWMKDRDGGLWQKRFYDRGLRGMIQLSRELDYVHNNPVRAGLVNVPGEYEFSSYTYYFGNGYRDLIDHPA